MAPMLFALEGVEEVPSFGIYSYDLLVEKSLDVLQKLVDKLLRVGIILKL
jgi:hypothetical protein